MPAPVIIYTRSSSDTTELSPHARQHLAVVLPAGSNRRLLASLSTPPPPRRIQEHANGVVLQDGTHVEMPSTHFDAAAQVAVNIRKGFAPRNTDALYGGGGVPATVDLNNHVSGKNGAKNLKTALAVQRLAVK